MLRFILRRLGFMVVTVILASIIIFWATTILPGDVATMVLGRYATQQAKDTLRTELGLDKPIAVQYTTWLGKYVRGDWGTSVSTDTAVSYTHLRAHETRHDLVCRLLLEKKKTKKRDSTT